MADNEAQESGAMPETSSQGAMPEADATSENPSNFSDWFESQDDSTKSIIQDRMSSLEGALSSERSERRNLAKQLKDTMKRLDETSEAAQELQQLSTRLENQERQAKFYDEAVAAGCNNLKLAWLAAQSDDLSVEQVQENYPELFARPVAARTNAGSGSSQAPERLSMNEYIRRAAGFS